MNKIKVSGIIIFLLLIALLMVSKNIGDHTKINNNLLETINKQKGFIQEIAKNIFYIYKNKNSSTKQLDNSIKLFLENMDCKEERLNQVSSFEIKKQSKKIAVSWNKFYLKVQKFKDHSKVVTPYTNLLLKKIVNDIYLINLNLIVEFDKLILLHNKYFDDEHSIDKLIQYSLFFLLLIVLSYFLYYISRTTNNIDMLMKKIDNTIKSIEQIENNVETVLESIDGNSDELIKNEDAVIESLEELISSQIKLKNLQIDLDKLFLYSSSIKLKNKN